jgi:hypothetical protein
VGVGRWYADDASVRDDRVLDFEELLHVLHLALVLVHVGDDLGHLGHGTQEVLVVKVVFGCVLHDLLLVEYDFL